MNNYLNFFHAANSFEMVDEKALKQQLDNQKYGATTEVLITSEFTLDGYLPKVFLPIYNPPGALPRKVQIDR